jgi:hypothetical protein
LKKKYTKEKGFTSTYPWWYDSGQC